ncbi:hypothetical protein B0J18DRAFT_150323 [Chaetomium sp. MPI-SDFR-AT-0129]|nr:hypothetical protein B0J18DRAFT_150323 [Chaetomium sp. MPI-SDFR-AT-0129]
MRFTPTFLFTTLASMAMAAPRFDRTIKELALRRSTAPVQATPTSSGAAATCTNGIPASNQHPAYPINDYTIVTPVAADWTSYTVSRDWYDDHYVSGPHIMFFSHKSDPYGPFKCQYTCNGEDKCTAYFVWYDNINTNDERMNCVLFDSIIPTNVFVPANGTIASGAYDKLCSPSI